MKTETPVILIGAGGHGMVLLDALLLMRVAVLGFVDSDVALVGRTILGHKVLGGEDVLGAHAPDTVKLVNAIGSTGSLERRRSVFERLHAAGYFFSNVVHPSAIVSQYAVTATGAQVMAGAVIQASAIIGEDSIINTGAQVDHDCKIGAHVHLAPGATLSGNVHIGDETHIGPGATVIQGVRIGERCTIAAGAVVLNAVEDDSTVAGVPARRLR